MIIKDLFYFKTGNLPALELTDDGEIPLVYGASRNNGIVKFVSVDNKDQIFKPPLITVSYLGTAFVQLVPFTTSVVDKSNIIVLEPKCEMSIEEMYFYAIQINQYGRFGFHYGRRMNMERLSKLEMEEYKGINIKIDFKETLPKKEKGKIMPSITKYSQYNIEYFFKIVKGQGQYLTHLDMGKTPIVSATNENNGVKDYVDTQPIFNAPSITIERVAGTAFVQINDFITVPDDILVLEPIQNNIDLEFLLYIALLINLNKWKYCYGRKLTKARIKKIDLSLPCLENGNVNINYIKHLAHNCYGWNVISNKILN